MRSNTILRLRMPYKKWADGAKFFVEFWSKIQRKDALRLDEIGNIQALFLREKPAVWNNEAANMHFSLLKQYGMCKKGGWIYDPQQVQAIAKKYSSVFQKKNIKDVFEYTLDDAQTGLLLGIPWLSIQRFVRLQKIFGLQTHRRDLTQRIMQESSEAGESMSGLMRRLLRQADALRLNTYERKFLERWHGHIYAINIYGVAWIDIGPIQQSLRRQALLCRAFESTGLTKLVQADFDAIDMQEYLYDVRRYK